jgi:hypothetical protein
MADEGDLTSDQRIRVADYLDDKLQTPDDLRDLDGLLADVKARYSVLKKQVSEI